MHENTLRKNSLGLAALVFFVVAAASPLTGLVGGFPIGMIVGNGVGMPLIYIISGIVILVFSIGFITMSKYISNSGAFYMYIKTALGDNFGNSSFCIAFLAYISIQIAIVAMFGLFCQLLFQEFMAINLAWWVYATILLLVITFLGIQKIEIGGLILGCFMILEVSIALLFSGLIFYEKLSSGQLDFSVFSMTNLIHGGVGVSLVFAIAGFIGFESTAIYAEECKNPLVNIPRATVIAVLIIMLFFTFCSWSIIQFHGLDNAVSMAANNPETYVFIVAENTLGKWSTLVINILLITSLFAATQAFHNNVSRYIFSLARNKMLPIFFASISQRTQSPYVASIAQSIAVFILLMLLVLAQQDPMTDIFAWGSVIATLCIMLLQALVSISVIKYFKDRPNLNETPFKVLYCPILATGLMLGVIVLVLQNLHVMSGVNSNLVYLMPILVLFSAIAGFVYPSIVNKFFNEK